MRDAIKDFMNILFAPFRTPRTSVLDRLPVELQASILAYVVDHDCELYGVAPAARARPVARAFFDAFVALLESEGARGSKACLTCLGRAYELGALGLRPSFEEAVRTYQNGAAVGSVVCTSRAARIYHECGCPAEALTLYKRGAQLGDGEACCNVLKCYANGIGCEKDDVKAFYYMVQGVDAGNGDCIVELGKGAWDGTMYPGVPRNREFAAKLWIEASNAHDNKEAMFLSGMVCDVAYGNFSTDAAASSRAAFDIYARCQGWLQRAARAGHARATYVLACDPRAGGVEWHTHARRKHELEAGAARRRRPA